MTNFQIIETTKVELFKNGTLKSYGKIKVKLIDGSETEIDDIQPIHTFNRWKQLGYLVKKGQKSFIKFPIWKYTSSKKNEEESMDDDGHCFMKMSAFFTDEQVEKIEEE